MKAELAVFIRIAIWMLVGRLSEGGWLPDNIAVMVTSPETVEAATTIVLGVGNLLWYVFSYARAALKTRTTTVTLTEPVPEVVEVVPVVVKKKAVAK